MKQFAYFITKSKMKSLVLNGLFLFCFLFDLTDVADHPTKDSRSSGIKRKFIIDTDAGVDDAVGILLALRYAEFERKIDVLAITCTYGNTNLKNVERNVQKILTVAKRSDIPIYSGADKPLLAFWKDSHYFGTDGMNDFKFGQRLTAKVDESKHASLAMIDLVNAHPGEITIIVLGPTTNVALAASLNPTFMENVGQFVVMGSTITGQGNTAPGVDFNFGCDPESNYILLNNTKKPILLVPREASLNSPIFMKWRQTVLAQVNSPVIDFLNNVEKVKKCNPNDYWSSADQRAVAIALWPNLIISKVFDASIIPVREGEARGSVLVERRKKTGRSINARAVDMINTEAFQKKLILYFSPNCKKECG